MGFSCFAENLIALGMKSGSRWNESVLSFIGVARTLAGV